MRIKTLVALYFWILKFDFSFSEKPDKNDQRCQISVRPDTSQCESRCRVCAVTIPIRRRARALSSSGRLITPESVYTLVSDTFAYQSPYNNSFLRFAYPRVKKSYLPSSQTMHNYTHVHNFTNINNETDYEQSLQFPA